MSVSTTARKICVTTASTATLLFAMTMPAFAAPSTDATGLQDTAGAAGMSLGAGLPSIIGSMIGAALGLLGVIFVCLLIYAGFLWMTAQGNDEKVKQAKKILSQSVIGLILIFSAYMITNVVISSLTTSLK